MPTGVELRRARSCLNSLPFKMYPKLKSIVPYKYGRHPTVKLILTNPWLWNTSHKKILWLPNHNLESRGEMIGLINETKWILSRSKGKISIFPTQSIMEKEYFWKVENYNIAACVLTHIVVCVLSWRQTLKENNFGDINIDLNL